MVHHDVAGTVRQEQIVQYIQHITPVHATNGGRGEMPFLRKKCWGICPHALIPLCIQHTIQLHIGLNIERGLYSRPV